MNYYPFHVGDYTAHTAHLEPLEDLAYRRMLDAYYLREEPMPADPKDVARLIRMRGNLDEVETVLREYFTLCEDGWRQGRCDAEIVRMQDKQAKARASAAASVEARRAKAGNERSTDAERTLNGRSTDVELPTPTPTPTPTPIPEENKKASCAAPPSPAPAESEAPSKPKPEKPSSPVFIAIPLNSGEEYPITESDVAEFRDLYPAVDVPQALRNIRGWALANPAKRKTRAGVRRFVNAWLAKDQDKGQQVVQLSPPARAFREVSL